MPVSTLDRIEKSLVLKAPRARVWKAVADSAEFGAWFGVAVEGPFQAGRAVRARVTHPPEFAWLTFEMVVEALEPERLFSFRWHPAAVDRGVDYSKEPTTLVSFTLEDAPGGTRLIVVESGFGSLPASRRSEAFRLNDRGWAMQMTNVERHVSGS